MKAAIAQPTYLPWLGYFDLMDQADVFVILDSVQFEKQSWQQRNRIRTPAGLQWLTVPVAFRGRLAQRIDEVEIREPNFWETHLRAIELNYRRTPYFATYFAEFAGLLQDTHAGCLLVNLNLKLICWFIQMLGLRTQIYRSSAMQQTGKRTELLANILQSLSANEYISPLGSADYLLSEMRIMTDHGIEVGFQHYEHPEYKQRFAPFQSHATVLDLLFNEGPRSLQILRSGRRALYSPEEVMLLLAKQVEV